MRGAAPLDLLAVGPQRGRGPAQHRRLPLGHPEAHGQPGGDQPILGGLLAIWVNRDTAVVDLRQGATEHASLK
jgi:hypothetical protein